MTALFLALLLSADGGSSRLDVQQLVSEAFSGEADAKRIAELEALASKASPAERAFIERTLALVSSKDELETLVPKFLPLLADATAYAKGSMDDELGLSGAYISLNLTAQSARLDPAPYRTAALAYGKDLVTRYPKEARAHGVFASLLYATEGDPDLARTELKTCASLGSESCIAQYQRVLAELERPRCTGATMKKRLGMWGATVVGPTGLTPTPPGALVWDGLVLRLEPQPFLESSAFRFVAVDPDGSLSLETSKADARRLEHETTRLLGKFFVLKLGDEVLLAGKAQSAISGGRLRVTPGQGKPPFTLEALCKTIERPKVPDALRLK